VMLWRQLQVVQNTPDWWSHSRSLPLSNHNLMRDITEIMAGGTRFCDLTSREGLSVELCALAGERQFLLLENRPKNTSPLLFLFFFFASHSNFSCTINGQSVNTRGWGRVWCWIKKVVGNKMFFGQHNQATKRTQKTCKPWCTRVLHGARNSQSRGNQQGRLLECDLFFFFFFFQNFMFLLLLKEIVQL